MQRLLKEGEDMNQVRLCGDQLVGMLRMICQHHRFSNNYSQIPKHISKYQIHHLKFY